MLDHRQIKLDRCLNTIDEKRVIYVLKTIRIVYDLGIRRIDAIQIVANDHNITVNTVSDKIIRGLGISIPEFDTMLEMKSWVELQDKMVSSWGHSGDIRYFFKILMAELPKPQLSINESRIIAKFCTLSSSEQVKFIEKLKQKKINRAI